MALMYGFKKSGVSDLTNAQGDAMVVLPREKEAVMNVEQLKVIAEQDALNADLLGLEWHDNDGISIGIDWFSNVIYVCDENHPDGAKVEVGSFSDLREVFTKEIGE
jgi:hypothetical protein